MKEMNSHMAENPIDLAPLLEDCLGQVDMPGDLLVIYKSHVGEFFEDMDQNLPTSNREGIAFATTRLNTAEHAEDSRPGGDHRKNACL